MSRLREIYQTIVSKQLQSRKTSNRESVDASNRAKFRSVQQQILLRINWQAKSFPLFLLNSLARRTKRFPGAKLSIIKMSSRRRKNVVVISRNKLTFNLRLTCKQLDMGSVLQKKSMIMFLWWKIWWKGLCSWREDLTRYTVQHDRTIVESQM